MDEPDKFSDLSRRKQLEFERKRLVKLRGFFDHERDIMERQPTRPTFLRAKTAGQLDLYWDMMERMIQSKNYAIYEAIKKEKEDRIEGVGEIMEPSVGSEVEDPHAIEEEEVEEDRGSDG